MVEQFVEFTSAPAVTWAQALGLVAIWVLLSALVFFAMNYKQKKTETSDKVFRGLASVLLTMVLVGGPGVFTSHRINMNEAIDTDSRQVVEDLGLAAFTSLNGNQQSPFVCTDRSTGAVVAGHFIREGSETVEGGALIKTIEDNGCNFKVMSTFDLATQQMGGMDDIDVTMSPRVEMTPDVLDEGVEVTPQSTEETETPQGE